MSRRSVLKRKANAARSTEQAQHVARTIARKFGPFECDRSAKEIAQKLGKDFDASFVRLRTSDNSDVIGLAQEGIQISMSGVHLGIRIGDKVFDNLHYYGVPDGDWMRRFVAATEAPLVKQSQPIGGILRENIPRQEVLSVAS